MPDDETTDDRNRRAPDLDRVIGRAGSRAGTGPALDLAALRRTQEYLVDNLAEHTALDELAVVAGTSKFGLIRLFQRYVGMPPYAYQIGLRVERARRLLAAGVAPAQAGAMVGFYDQSHFHRHFRRRCGMTPGRYVAMLGAAAPGRGSGAVDAGPGSGAVDGYPAAQPSITCNTGRSAPT